MYVCVCVPFRVHAELDHVSREYFFKNMHENKGAKDVKTPEG